VSRPPGADREQVRAQIVAYLAGHGQASQPEIRRHLVTTYSYSERLARRVTAEIIRGPGFELERLAHRGPRTIHVRLAPERRRRRST